jgi:hypothetical protein
MADKKEPFIPQSDRPDVKIDPDKAVGELSVRDLQSILGGSQQIYKIRKDVDKYQYKEYYKEYFKEYIKEHVYDKFIIEGPIDPTTQPDPAAGGIAQLVNQIGGLHEKIDGLTNQIAELKKAK